MTPTIVQLKVKNLVGMCLKISLAAYKINDLWRAFLARRNEINNTISQDLFSIACYKADHFTNFSMNNEFDRWAAVELSDYDNIPIEMKPIKIPEGLYAVFNYKGLSSDPSIFQYIYTQWLPASEYVLDHRPHFEILGEKYKNNDPNSEESIWIPIKKKVSF